MYQACDYHTVAGYVYVNLSCSIELTTLNKKSYGYSQNLSDLWLPSSFVISVELVLVLFWYDLQWWMLTPLSPMNPNSAKIAYSNEKHSMFYKPKGTLGGKTTQTNILPRFICQDKWDETTSKTIVPRDSSYPEKKKDCLFSTRTLIRKSWVRTVKCCFFRKG